MCIRFRCLHILLLLLLLRQIISRLTNKNIHPYPKSRRTYEWNTTTNRWDPTKFNDRHCDIEGCDLQHMWCKHTTLLNGCPGHVMEDLALYKYFILQKYSYYRDLIASGLADGYEPALLMDAVASWTPERAEKHAKLLCAFVCPGQEIANCSYPYIEEFPFILMYMYKGDDLEFTIEEVISDAFRTWFDESEKCDMAVMRKYTKETSAKCPNFVNLAVDTIHSIGCALLTLIGNGKRTSIFICATLGANLPHGSEIYKRGEASSWCEMRHPNYRGLCFPVELRSRGSAGETKPTFSTPNPEDVITEGSQQRCQLNFGILFLPYLFLIALM